MWGFLTCLNDILIPHLKAVFELNFSQAMLVQFTFFGAYFLMSLPAEYVVARLGYKKGIVAGLLIAAIGTFCFWPTAEMRVWVIPRRVVYIGHWYHCVAGCCESICFFARCRA